MPAGEGTSPLEIDPAVIGVHQNADTFSISVPDEVTPPTPRGGGPSVPQIKSGIFGTSSNLVNSIVGAGIIGIPYAFKQSGLVAGVLLLALVAYMTGTDSVLADLLAMFPVNLTGCHCSQTSRSASLSNWRVFTPNSNSETSEPTKI